MKTGVWVGSLILSLGGWMSNLLAQDGPWRPATPGPVPTTLAPSELKPCPAATIGRPIAVTEEPKFERVPTSATSGLEPASYHPPFFPPGSAAPSAREIPDGDKLPTWIDVDGGPKALRAPIDNGFASDRVQPVLPPIMDGGAVQQTGLLHKVPPAEGEPAETGWSSPLPTTLPPLGEDISYPMGRGPGRYSFGDVPPELNPTTPHFYVTAEYLLWWLKKDNTPPLVTTSTAPNGSGFLNDPSTTVLFGGPINSDPRSGFRGNAGLWLDTWCEEAIEFGGFFLGQRSQNFVADSGPNGVLARPFFNVNTGMEFAELTAFPGISTGRITVTTPSSLWGLDSNFRCNLCLACDHRFDLYFGFRYLNLDEGITIMEDLVGEAGAPAPFTNAHTMVTDSFNAHNQFYGGQIGFSSEWKYGAWSLDVLGKVALGATQQQLNIAGLETIIAPNGMVSNFNGGLLALPSNSGQFSQTKFSVVPEVGVTLGYQLTDTIRLYAGYNFLYWTNVIRPGQQIDRNLDVTQIPNFNIAGAKPAATPSPTVPFKESNLWAQGIMVGIEFRY